jgi:glycine cleavage system H protein
VIGFVEAFKAVSDLYSVIQGTFKEINPQLLQDYGVVSSSPYHQGWLYRIEGIPDHRCLKVQNYIELLNETIDRMREHTENGVK